MSIFEFLTGLKSHDGLLIKADVYPKIMQAAQSAAEAVLNGMTLAVVRMSAMVDFYESVFAEQFQPVEAYGAMLFRGKVAGLDLLLYPQELAGINTDQNRTMLKFRVRDVAHILDTAMRNGGSLLNAPTEDGRFKTAAVRDPDGNSIEFEQPV